MTIAPLATSVVLGLACGSLLPVIALSLYHRQSRARRSGNPAARLQPPSRAGADTAVSILVRPDGTSEIDDRAAGLLGMAPGSSSGEALAAIFNSELDNILLDRLSETRSTGGCFTLSAQTRSGRVVRIDGQPAGADPGAVMLWLTDDTENQQQIAALRQEVRQLSSSVDSLSALLEAAPFPIWLRGDDLRLALVNHAYVDAVEGESAMAVIRSGVELIDEGEGRSPLREAADALKLGGRTTRSIPATIAGERRTMEVVEVPLGSGVAGFAIDVHERELARTELSRFVQAQRDMLDRLSAGVAQFGRDRGLIFANAPFLRQFALTAELLSEAVEFDRLLDRMRERRTLPEVRDFPQWKRERRGWFLSDEAVEEDWLLPGGRHLRVVAQPLPDGGLLLIFEDRTEQNQLASARDTLLRVRAATFNNLFEAVGVFASDGRLHLWNDLFREVWGFEEEELAAHPRIDRLLPGIAAKLKRRSLANYVRELVRSATVERKQRNGRVNFADGRDFAFAAVPLPDGNALFTMLDVTDSRRIEAALRDRNRALEQADRVKTAFVSNMSYELRTPLTSINGFAEMLAGGYAGALPPAAVEYVAAINEAAGRLGMLVDNVLDLTQSGVGGLPLEEDRVDVRSLCSQAADREAPTASRKKIDMVLDIEASAGELTGDAKRLSQAIGNVVRNAVSYTRDGGRVRIHAEGTARGVEIIVSDNGPGLPAVEQARVFDQFRQLADDAHGGRASLSLGLPVARQIVEAHGGTLTLESEMDEGTRVTFFLPRSR